MNTDNEQCKKGNTNNDKAPNIEGTKAFDTIVSVVNENSIQTECVPVYDISVSNDKYVNTVLYKNCATKLIGVTVT